MLFAGFSWYSYNIVKFLPGESQAQDRHSCGQLHGGGPCSGVLLGDGTKAFVVKKVNAQLREAGYTREDRRMKCDGAKTWVSNTVQEPGLS